MRFVTRDLADKSDILTEQTTVDDLQEVVTNAGKPKITANFYQDVYKDTEGKRQMRVRDKLNVYYFHKCAYCERNCKAEIEHYRPKAGVTGDTAHPGYYWLCYEWSNLLPSCHECNTSGGKQNQFPVRGTRVIAPPFKTDGELDSTKMLAYSSPLIDEQPYLLHPEIDDPTLFLGVEIDPKGEGLKLSGLDGLNERGEQTIRICNLNRTDLKINRLKKLDEFIAGINLAFKYLAYQLLSNNEFVDAIELFFQEMDEKAKDDRSEYTLLLRNTVANDAKFASLVLPRLEVSQRHLVYEAFKKYRSENPL